MIYSVCKTRVCVLEISPKVLNNDDEVQRLKKRIVHSMDKASVWVESYLPLQHTSAMTMSTLEIINKKALPTISSAPEKVS